MMMMMMMYCFFGMVDQRKAFSLISRRDHYQRSSPSRTSNTPRVFQFHNDILSSTCKKGVFLVLSMVSTYPKKWKFCYFKCLSHGSSWLAPNQMPKNHISDALRNKTEGKLNIFRKDCTRSALTQFFKCFSTPIYIPKYFLSKKLICSIAVLPLLLKTLKKKYS